MIIDIKQNDKTLFEANFDIVSNKNILGNINIKGKLGSMEGYLNGVYNNIPFSLKYSGNTLIKNKNNRFRPYQVIESNNVVGEIYQSNKKTGIFSGYEYKTLIYNNNIYNQFGIGLGKETKCPIYLNDEQIAEIEKENTVYNDLHNFKLYIKNEEYSFISILFACYMYINACFKPGTKIKESVNRYYSKTTNKELNSKYNPDWIKSIGDEKL